MNKKRIYFDMDGVLVDFQTGIDKLDEATKEQYKGKLDEVPGIFSLMEPIPGAAEVVRLLARNYDVFILTTSPWNNPTAASDKVEWVKKYLDDVFHKRVIITHRKDLLDGDYLIDDRGKNGTSEFKGEWIHFGSERFPDWESVLKYLLM
jgi:5'(3')-deoxyribonucleotidase